MYSSGFAEASAALETIAVQSWFPNFCEAKVHIESLLIKPVQRLPRYSMLLEVSGDLSVDFLFSPGLVEKYTAFSSR